MGIADLTPAEISRRDPDALLEGVPPPVAGRSVPGEEAAVSGMSFAQISRGMAVSAMCFGKVGGVDALIIATGDRIWRMAEDGSIREMVFYPVANPLLPPVPT